MTPDELKAALAEWTPGQAVRLGEPNWADSLPWPATGRGSPLSDAAIPELMARLDERYGPAMWRLEPIVSSRDETLHQVALYRGGWRDGRLARTRVCALWLAVLEGGV